MAKNKLFLPLVLAAGLLLSTPVFSAPIAASNVVVKNPVVATNNNNQASIFLILNNKNQDRNYSIVAATSPVAKQIQLGKAIGHGAEMKIKAVKDIVVEADDTKTLKANGLHIALIGLKQQLHAGDTVPVTLIFADGSYIDFRATVGKNIN